MAEWFVAKSSEMKDGYRRIVTAGKREIGVFHKDGAFYAYSNQCLHQGGPACEGMITQNVVDVIDKDRLKTGECVGDRKQKLRKFEVIERGGDIYVVA
jgi:nitrite reductase/ring-hydroxylating ferredoxin subunit